MVLDQHGSIQPATGWDEVSQRYARRLLTNAAITLPDGSTVVAEYIFHPDFGLSLRALIGQLNSADLQAQLSKKALDGAKLDDQIDQAIPPVLNIVYTDDHYYYIDVSFTLVSKRSGSIALALPTGGITGG